MFVDWKNQYSENGYITQRYLQIQYNPYQVIFHRTRTNNFTICVETQTLNDTMDQLDLIDIYLFSSWQLAQIQTLTICL